LGFDVSSVTSRNSFFTKRQSTAIAIGLRKLGIEEAAIEVFGREPSRGSSRQTEEVISVGSAMLEDPLPWGMGTLPISIRKG
jgi:hypothetical protein